MLKQERKKRKSDHFLINDFKKAQSNFNDTSISMSTKSLMFQKLKTLEQIINIPKPDQQSILITKRAVNSFDFILALIAKHGKIDELIISFYRVGKKVVNELNDLYERGKIPKVHLLVNDGFPKLVPDCWNLIKSYENKSFSVHVENTHTKIILVKCEENYYVIQGSGNLSINARIEQYAFFNQKEIYDFHKDWITNIK